MITSENKVRRFVIATPTKCGTTTLEEMCRRHGGGRVSRGGVENPSFRIMTWEQPRRQHRMVPPEGWEDADRFFLARNPLSRYPSMYEYLRNPTNYSKFGAREIQGRTWGGLGAGRKSPYDEEFPMTFEEFLWFIAYAREDYNRGRWLRRRGAPHLPSHYRSPWVWLDPLHESRRKFFNTLGSPQRKDTIFLETLWDDLDAIKKRYRLDDLSTRRSIHANRTLTYQMPTRDYWNSTCVSAGWRGEEWSAVRASTRACGDCGGCAVGVVGEAARLGY